MLVLSRKVGEEIVIDGDIVLTVVEVNGNRVKIGIRAPREKVVVRGELVGQGRDLDAMIPPPQPPSVPAPTPGIPSNLGFFPAWI